MLVFERSIHCPLPTHALRGLRWHGNASSATLAANVPTLWGVDEDDGELFSIADYNDPVNSATIYGDLMFDNGGSIERVNQKIGAFALENDGTAYIARNESDLGPTNPPILMSFDVNTASQVADNIVDIVGMIDMPAPFDASNDNISGFSLHPQTGDLYALGRIGDH